MKDTHENEKSINWHSKIFDELIKLMSQILAWQQKRIEQKEVLQWKFAQNLGKYKIKGLINIRSREKIAAQSLQKWMIGMQKRKNLPLEKK